LSIAHDYDVDTLSLPAILKELQSEVEASNRVRTTPWRGLGVAHRFRYIQIEDCVRAAEVVGRTVKAFLNDKAMAEDTSLKTVQFLCCSRSLFPTYLTTLSHLYGLFER